MKLQVHSSIYLLIFLLCMFVVNAQNPDSNDTSVSTSDNADSINNQDVKQDLEKLLVCAKNTTTIGILITEITNISNLIISMLPSFAFLRDQYIQYLINFLTNIINFIVLLGKWSDILLPFIRPLL